MDLNYQSFIYPCQLWVEALLLVIILANCSNTTQKPPVTSKKYKQAVADFYVSLAAIQSNQARFAIKKMKQVGESFPKEPAVWANLSVYAMRQGNFKLASEHMEKALNRAEDNGQLQFLTGILQSRMGDIQSSITHLRAAAQIDSTNFKALYKLSEELEREDATANARRIQKLLNQILRQDPDNLAVLAERVRIVTKWGDKAELKSALKALDEQSKDWPSPIKEQFREQEAAILKKKGNEVSFELAFLRNNLNELSKFQHDLRRVQLPANQIGFLISSFLWLPNADHSAAPIDKNLAFNVAKKYQDKKKAQLFRSVWLSKSRPVNTLAINGRNAILNDKQTLYFPGNVHSDRLSPNAVAVLDYNYDFLNDLAFVGPEGFKLYKQKKDSAFIDVTDSTRVPSFLLNKQYTGVWARDLDLDGDLDLLLALQKGGSVTLRNNGDGTSKKVNYIGEKQKVRDFLWADFDRDGDPDAVILTTKGSVHYYENMRGATFRRDPSFSISKPVKALNFGDINSDGIFEIVSWQPGQISSLQYSDFTKTWQSKKLMDIEQVEDQSTDFPRLFIADLDNNAALDVMISDQQATKYWLTDENINLKHEVHTVPANIYALADMNNNNRLDLIGSTDQNKRIVWNNSGREDYKAQRIRPRASGPLGDRRINSFGIGGEIESRSGRQYVKQPIDRPILHVGLGKYKQADMMRILWPNGSIQADFAELGYSQEFLNKQLLKGSCPWVFTYNGDKMEFVTDFIWRTALGLKINLQGASDVIHSIDWIKIDGNQLQPRNDMYDVRITADLWETHYFDHVSLMAVDHPKKTEVFVDERFKLPAPEQKLYPIESLYPVQSAKDQDSRDVTKEIAFKDGNYVDSFALTSYQGVAKEHYIELELGKKPPAGGEQKLIAFGWVYPTDTSINIAVNQSKDEPLHGIGLKVPDSEGGWKMVQSDIGFPSGKNKTIIINVEDIFVPGTPHKVRLYTNMEIYWDQIRVGIQQDGIPLRTHRLEADSVNLRYRGFSTLEQTNRFSPTVPDYQKVAGTTAKWRDLTGYYTRYGQVSELMRKSDDRYVIMNAGDELSFNFPVLDSPPKGWTRDFVLIGDGWIKDGDYNSGYSKTVLPLPYHGMKDYSSNPGLLQDDPVYQKHKQDWATYHTRYITPYSFNTALKLEQ